ncbi:MAG: Wzz/FepE/Etk N-terminal domain-containing protein [Solirubrobacteraceae bacterium]
MMTDQLADTMAALRRHLRLIIIVPILAVIVSLVLSETAQKQYTATATVLLLPSNPVDQLLNPASSVTPADPERDLNTEVSQITEAPVLAKVRAALKLGETDEQLLTKVSTSVEGTTNLVDVAVTDSSPEQAAAIANAFADEYVQYRLTVSRAAIEQAIGLVKSQLATAGKGPVRTELKSRLQQLQVYSSVQTSDAQVSQQATVPQSPSSPKPLSNALIALLVGLIVGVVLAVVLDLLDRHVRDEEEAERVAGLDVLARIPEPSMKAKRRNAVRRHPLIEIESEQSEAYRSLAVSVSARVRADPRAQIVMVTSPGPRDGKTTITLGLAAGLADLGLRVIAVEADLRRPRFAELLGLGAGEGVSSILAGSHELADAETMAVDFRSLRPMPRRVEEPVGAAEHANTVVRAPESRLNVLPAGVKLGNPQSLLAGQAMAALLVDLRASADVVLLDTPPIGVVSDAAVLAPMVDRALVVAHIGHTKRTALARTRRVVDQTGVSTLGLVLVGGARGSLGYYG